MSKQPVTNSVGDRGGGFSLGIRLSYKETTRQEDRQRSKPRREDLLCSVYLFSYFPIPIPFLLLLFIHPIVNSAQHVEEGSEGGVLAIDQNCRELALLHSPCLKLKYMKVPA
jgi:hypothetical protein